MLNVYWLRLGIQHQPIHPASPQENGGHARMHHTLKRRAIHPARANAHAQQRAFNAFRTEYNQERPHSHHGGTPPGAHYTSSPLQQRLLFLANALDNYYVGLEEIDDGIWSIYFGTVLLARFDERNGVIRE